MDKELLAMVFEAFIREDLESATTFANQCIQSKVKALIEAKTYTHAVKNKKGEVVGKYQSKNAARRAVDKKDQVHGSYYHSVHPITAEGLDLKPADAGALVGQKSVPNAFGKDKFKKATKAPKVKKSKYGVDGVGVGGGTGASGGAGGSGSCGAGGAGASGGAGGGT